MVRVSSVFSILAAGAAWAAVSAVPAQAARLADAFADEAGSLVPLDPQATPRWASVVSRAERERTIPTPADCRAKQARADCAFAIWERQLAKFRRHSPSMQLAFVQQRINAIPYATDAGNWGATDYWESPREMFARGGDCEGYALTKYFGLRTLGFADRAMRIAILWDRVDQEEHAALLVRTDEMVWLLDNKFAKPQRASAHDARYQLLYTVNEGGVRLAPGRLLGSGASAGAARLVAGGRRLAVRVEPRRHAEGERYNPIPFAQRSAAALAALTVSPRATGAATAAIAPMGGAGMVEDRSHPGVRRHTTPRLVAPRADDPHPVPGGVAAAAMAPQHTHPDPAPVAPDRK